jgi:AcrR family transcriptional regulator
VSRYRAGVSSPPERSRPSRREEYAAATRAGIITAARELFGEQGYFATKVDSIAERARVAPATVYAVAGGKQGLLRTLIEQWTASPRLAEYYEQVEHAADGEKVLRITAAGTRETREAWGDVMRVVLATAPHDETAAAGLAVATERYRGAFVQVADRLVALGSTDLERDRIVDVLWFYFGYASYFVLVEDNGWSFADAEAWLLEQAGRALGVKHRRRRPRGRGASTSPPAAGSR